MTLGGQEAAQGGGEEGEGSRGKGKVGGAKGAIRGTSLWLFCRSFTLSDHIYAGQAGG